MNFGEGGGDIIALNGAFSQRGASGLRVLMEPVSVFYYGVLTCQRARRCYHGSPPTHTPSTMSFLSEL